MSRTYETAIKIGATISKAFKGDVHGAAAALTKLSDVTKSLKSAEKSASSFKKLDDAVKQSKGGYSQASDALRRLKEAEQAAGGATKESTAWRKAGERAVAKASREFDRSTKAAEKNAKALHAMGVDTAHLTTEQGRLARALAATERQEKALEHYEHSRERLFGAKKEKTPLFEKAHQQVEGIVELGAKAFEAGAKLYELVNRTAEAGEGAEKMSKRMGIGVEVLQELRYAGQRTGATIEDVDKAIGKMGVNIGKHKMAKGAGGGLGAAIPGLQMLDTGTGGGAAADPFKQLHLSAAKLSQLKPEQQFDKIADAMKGLKTDAERSAIAVAIFGKGGLAMIPALKLGGAGLAKLREEARATGSVMSEEATAQAHEFIDAQRDARLAVVGLTNTLGTALLPVVTETFRDFSAWVKTNRVEIKKWIAEAATWIEKKGIPALRNIAREAQAFGLRVLHLVEVGAKLTGGLGNLALVVAGLRLAPLALTLGQISANAVKAAVAIFRYVAAKKAAAAAGVDVAGMSPDALTGAGKAIGLAASAAMVIGAASVGYAIGSYLDEKFGISDWIAGKVGAVSGQKEKLEGIEKAGVELNDLQLQRRKIEKRGLVRKYEGKGLTHGQAVYAADQLTTQQGGKNSIDLSGLNISIGGGSREEVESQLDEALEKIKTKVVHHLDQREKHRKRVSYAE